jgi:sigma54-dependent transcription regulator
MGDRTEFNSEARDALLRWMTENQATLDQVTQHLEMSASAWILDVLSEALEIDATAVQRVGRIRRPQQLPPRTMEPRSPRPNETTVLDPEGRI